MYRKFRIRGAAEIVASVMLLLVKRKERSGGEHESRHRTEGTADRERDQPGHFNYSRYVHKEQKVAASTAAPTCPNLEINESIEVLVPAHRVGKR